MIYKEVNKIQILIQFLDQIIILALLFQIKNHSITIKSVIAVKRPSSNRRKR